MFRIISLTEEYIDSLVELDKICFDDPWTKGMFLGDINSGQTCYFAVLNDADEVIGYAGMWLTADEGQITNIAVHPQYRRKNIATDLLCKLFKVCHDKNIRNITLEVRRSNSSAAALYEKAGFEVVGTRKNYYKKPVEDAILMTKTFCVEEID